MPTLSYEYSSSKNNNVINFGTSLLTAAPPLETGVLPAMIYTLQATGITHQASDVFQHIKVLDTEIPIWSQAFQLIKKLMQ